MTQLLEWEPVSATKKAKAKKTPRGFEEKPDTMVVDILPILDLGNLIAEMIQYRRVNMTLSFSTTWALQGSVMSPQVCPPLE